MRDEDKTQLFVPARHGMPARDAKLIGVSSGEGAPAVIPLTGVGVLLARDPAGNLSVSNTTNVDFRVFQTGSAWGVQVVAKDTAMLVNEAPMTLSFLKSGDNINLGGTNYVFRWADEAENPDLADTEKTVKPLAPKQASIAPTPVREPLRRRFVRASRSRVLALALAVAGALAMGLALTWGRIW